MKKVSLFFCFLLAATMSFAETKTVILDGSATGLSTDATTEESIISQNGFSYTMSKGGKQSAASGDKKFDGTTQCILIGKKGAYIYSNTAFGEKITKFELYVNKGAAGTEKTPAKLSVSFSTEPITTAATDAQIITIAGDTQKDTTYNLTIPTNAKYFYYTITTAHNSQVAFRITYEEASIQAPVFTPEEGKVTNRNFTESFLLTMSCTTTGTTIYYTTDGTDPLGTSSAEYTTPITIPAKSTVVRAIAMSDDEFSAETQATYYYINSATTAYTASAAIEVINAGLGLNNELYVQGTIKEITEYNATYGSLTYTITDGTKDLIIYGGLNENKAKFSSLDDLNVGDEVVVCGKLLKYKEDYEVNSNNYIVSRKINTPTITATNVAFGDLYSTNVTQELVVTGEQLTEAIRYSLSEGSAFSVEGELTTEGGTLTIIFNGMDENDYTATLTLTSGSITKEITLSASYHILEGLGTQEIPYTVADVKKLNNSLGTGEKYWVIGYIIGAIENNKLVTTGVDTNIALGSTADATEANDYIPVGFASGTTNAAKSDLNIKDNETIGKQVLVNGTLEKYFSVAGVKNVKEYATPTATEIEDNAASSVNTTTKCIENGALIIIRDGVQYTILGAVVGK